MYSMCAWINQTILLQMTDQEMDGLRGCSPERENENDEATLFQRVARNFHDSSHEMNLQIYKNKVRKL